MEVWRKEKGVVWGTVKQDPSSIQSKHRDQATERTSIAHRKCPKMSGFVICPSLHMQNAKRTHRKHHWMEVQARKEDMAISDTSAKLTGQAPRDEGQFNRNLQTCPERSREGLQITDGSVQRKST